MVCGAESKHSPINVWLAMIDHGRQLAETVLLILSPDPEDDVHLHCEASRNVYRTEWSIERDWASSSLWRCNQIARICLLTDEADVPFALEIMSATSAEGELCSFLRPLFGQNQSGCSPRGGGPDSMGCVICLLDRLTHIYLANYQYSVYCLFLFYFLIFILFF